jgi:hypothetical protein
MSLKREMGYMRSAENGVMGVLGSALRLKPPVAMRVRDLLNLARLTLVGTEQQTFFWHFVHRRTKILGAMYSIPYWKRSLPIFFYTTLPEGESVEAYVAYRYIDREEVFFTRQNDDPKFLYAPVVELDQPPRFLVEAISGKARPHVEMPVLTKTSNLPSLLRLLVVASYDGQQPPILRFDLNGKSVLGVLMPFYDYYEASALPVFIYVELDGAPHAGFIRYIASEGKEDAEFTDRVTDMKFFYARTVSVEDRPFWFSEAEESRRRRRKSVEQGSGAGHA